MALKKSVVVLCWGLLCWLRQCMNRLLLKRRNIPTTRMDWGLRTRHWSSRCDTSKRWCRPLSMPQAARLACSHRAAFNSTGGRLVTSATVSGACWRSLRRSKATCSTNGKSTCSAVAARERNTRTSKSPLLNSRRPANVAVACRGGKIRRRGGHQFLDILAQRRLVVFDGQQIIRAVFQHQFGPGLILGVERVQADLAPIQIQPLEQLSSHGNFIGLLIHYRAAQVVLAGYRHGGQHGMAAAVPRLFAVQHDQILGGCRTADLPLRLQKRLFQLVGVKVGHQAAEGRLAGGGDSPRLADARPERGAGPGSSLWRTWPILSGPGERRRDGPAARWPLNSKGDKCRCARGSRA